MIENEAACHFWESRGDFVTRGGQQTGAQGGSDLPTSSVFPNPSSLPSYGDEGADQLADVLRQASGLEEERFTVCA